MVEIAVSNVASSGKAITTVLADAGDWSPDHVVAKLDPDLLIATGKTKDLTADRPDPVALEAALVAVQQRSLTHRDPAATLGMPKTNFTRFVDASRKHPLRALARVKMAANLAEPPNRRRYRQRVTTIEPVFGQTKAVRGIRRFRRRGLHACAAEWTLIAATHNLLKWWRTTVSTAPSPT
jgi:Transposase DDE domain